MARPAGSRNADHDAKRAALVDAVVPVILGAGPERPSLRELARAAGVRPNTLRHYFGDRDGVVQAAFERIATKGGDRQAWARSLAALPPREGLRAMLHAVVGGWQRGALGGMHAAGLAEGMGHPTIGRTYIERILDPSLRVIEALLADWTAQGLLRATDPRTAALALFSPIMLALLHQRELDGAHCRPLDLAALVDVHVDHFLDGWGGAGA